MEFEVEAVLNLDSGTDGGAAVYDLCNGLAEEVAPTEVVAMEDLRPNESDPDAPVAIPVLKPEHKPDVGTVELRTGVMLVLCAVGSWIPSVLEDVVENIEGAVLARGELVKPTLVCAVRLGDCDGLLALMLVQISVQTPKLFGPRVSEMTTKLTWSLLDAEMAYRKPLA